MRPPPAGGQAGSRPADGPLGRGAAEPGRSPMTLTRSRVKKDAASATPARLEVTAGRPQPLGATPDADGVNFSIYSEFATTVELLLFESPEAPRPHQVIVFDPLFN